MTQYELDRIYGALRSRDMPVLNRVRWTPDLLRQYVGEPTEGKMVIHWLAAQGLLKLAFSTLEKHPKLLLIPEAGQGDYQWNALHFAAGAPTGLVGIESLLTREMLECTTTRKSTVLHL